MLFERQNAIEYWSTSDMGGKFPGRFAVIVGAGVSMSAPMNLPSGLALMRAALRHLLSESAFEEIFSVFEQCAPIFGRAIPRLEHVLDKTCNKLSHEKISRAGTQRKYFPNGRRYSFASTQPFTPVSAAGRLAGSVPPA